MSIPNKQVFVQGSSMTATQMNKFQDDFESWIQNHYHVHRNIPILTLTNESKIDTLIANDNFLYNFTNYLINTDRSFVDDTFDYVVLKMTHLSELYNRSVLLGQENTTLKNLIYSYSDNYRVDSDTDVFEFIFKNPTFTEDDLDITITIPQLTNNQFSFEGGVYTQSPQSIKLKKMVIKDFETRTIGTSTNVIELDIDILENAFVGIPSLPITSTIIIQEDGKTAYNHIQDTSLHVSAFATEAGLMEIAKYNRFSDPNWTSDHPLYTEGKFLISSNDKTLCLNVIKDELNTNESAEQRGLESPMDAMFRGNSSQLDWLRDNYFSGEDRTDANIIKGIIQDGFNYDVVANETAPVVHGYSQSQSVPSKISEAVPSTMFNEQTYENRVVRMVRDTKINSTQGDVIQNIPLIVNMIPNVHNKSYMYNFYYGRKTSNLNNSWLAGFKGQGLYSKYNTNLQYNISQGLYYEKLLQLGSPYECFNRGAEHIYVNEIAKDYSRKDVGLDGLYIKTRKLSELRKEEQRLI